MPTHANARTQSAGDLVFAAYRQAWLAGIGAAAVARDWMQTGAAPMLRSLVKEGTLVESQALRAVESRVESSRAYAGARLRSARKQAAAAAKEVRVALPAAIARLPLPAKFAQFANPAAAKPGKTARANKPARKVAVKRTVKKAVRARKRG
jgi:hypothetical protein